MSHCSKIYSMFIPFLNFIAFIVVFCSLLFIYSFILWYFICVLYIFQGWLPFYFLLFLADFKTIPNLIETLCSIEKLEGNSLLSTTSWKQKQFKEFISSFFCTRTIQFKSCKILYVLLRKGRRKSDYVAWIIFARRIRNSFLHFNIVVVVFCVCIFCIGMWIFFWEISVSLHFEVEWKKIGWWYVHFMDEYKDMAE